MNRLAAIITSFAVQLIITSCTGYGIIYDDKHLDISEDEQLCLEQPTSRCLLTTAAAISTSMSDSVTQAEALNILATSHYQLGQQTAALEHITAMPVLALQFNSLFELLQIAKKQHKNTAPLLKFADGLANNARRNNNQIAALLLRAILAFETDKPQSAQHYLTQSQALMANFKLTQDKPLDLQFFKKILPSLLQFKAFNTINALIEFQAKPVSQMLAQLEYSILLNGKNPKQAKRQFDSILQHWTPINDKAQDQLALGALIRALVRFNRLETAQQMLAKQQPFVFRATLRSIIINQLAKMKRSTQAKQALTVLLRDIRHFSTNTRTIKSQQALQDQFDLNTLRAQAIADVALALANDAKLAQAVYLAEQIQPLMGHIQGYSLTKIALLYAQQGDINSALLTMESIHRGINRAACLAQISAIVAKTADIDRAIAIANRIKRQSWRDIALSEISIAHARKNNINAAMAALTEIQRSYSSVYAMAKIAQILQTNKSD